MRGRRARPASLLESRAIGPRRGNSSGEAAATDRSEPRAAGYRRLPTQRPYSERMDVRPARPEDAAAVADIWFHGWRDGHLGNVSEELVAIRTDESFGRRAAERTGDTTLATVDDEVAGFVMVVDDEVEQVYVSSRHRGTGVAGTLLAEAERLVALNDREPCPLVAVQRDETFRFGEQRAGHERAWLAVVEGNARARRFYERNGWTDEGPFDYPAQSADGPIPVPCRRYVKRTRRGSAPA